MARDGVDVDRRVGGPADGAVDGDGVLEGGAGQDAVGREVLVDHRDDAPSGLVGVLRALLVRGGRGGRARQRHAEGLGKRVHGRGRAHCVAVAGARRGGGYHLDEFLIADLARRLEFARLPDDGAGADAPALPPAVEHRAAIERDRRQVRRRRRHDHRRRGLVAARGQDHPVDGIAVQHLDEPEIGEIAVDGGGRAAPALLDRVDGKLDGDAARLADAGAHALGQRLVDAVAGREVGAGLRDADDGLAGLQLLPRDAVIHVPLDIHGGHARIVWIVEPAPAAQLLPGHDAVSPLRLQPSA